MSIEKQLAEALRAADSLQPSPDLFARVELSIAETRESRRRRWTIAIASLAFLVCVSIWVSMGVRLNPVGSSIIESWRLVVAQLAVSGALIVALAPHIRRFSSSFVDDVFHLSPDTGPRFLTALDLAYYVFFTGLLLVDADSWSLASVVNLTDGLETVASSIGFLVLAMGLLHASNIALLPVLGLVYNSIVRRDLRRNPALDVPDEVFRARVADRNARSFAIGFLVLALSVAFALVVGPLSSLFTLD